jgi:glycosyltransferase EpsD
MTRKKVLFTSHTANFQKFNRPFMRWFREQDWEVHYASDGAEKILDCDKEFTIPFERSPFSLSNIRAIGKLKKIIDAEHYDIIHTHTPMGSVVTRLAARKARRNGTRVIYTAHGFHFFKGAPLLNWAIYYPIERIMARLTDTLITINSEDYERVKKKFKTNVQHVAGVGIELEKFEPRLTTKKRTELRSSLGIGNKDFVMIYPAELSKRKNQTTLLSITEILVKENPMIHLLLPGKDSMRGLHKKATIEKGIENNVHFLGYREDIPALLMASDLSISTSTQEGLPMHVMEAMTAKLPTVSFACRGVSELIINGQSGYIVEHGIEEAVKTVRKLVNKDTLYIDMGKRALENIKKNGFLINSVIDSMSKIYNIEYIKRKESTPTLAIVTPGLLPVPATRGGAVESLCENFIRENEIQKLVNVTILSTYDERAVIKSKLYKNTNFKFIKTPKIIRTIDLLIYTCAKFTLPTKNTAPLRYILQRFHFTRSVSKILSLTNYNHVLFENQILLLSSLRKRNNLSQYRARFSLHTHNEMNKTYGNRKLAALANNITVSDYVKDSLKSKLIKDMSAGKFSVVRNGVNQNLFYCNLSTPEKNKLRVKFGIDSHEKVLLFVGRLTADKGIDKLILALKHLKYTDYKLLIVGSSFFDTDVKNPFVSRLRKLAEPLANHVLFTGYIEYGDMPKIYSIADISIIPSVGVDAAPLTIIESLAIGLPIITTESGGIPEYVNDKCAKILKIDDSLAINIAKSIDTILANDDLREYMIQESFIAAKKLTSKHYYSDMLNSMGLTQHD